MFCTFKTPGVIRRQWFMEVLGEVITGHKPDHIIWDTVECRWMLGSDNNWDVRFDDEDAMRALTREAYDARAANAIRPAEERLRDLLESTGVKLSCRHPDDFGMTPHLLDAIVQVALWRMR